MSKELDLFQDNVIDPKMEVEGKWMPYARDVEVLVARAGNPDYKRVLRRKFKSARASLEQDDDVAMELSDELMQEVYAQTIFLGLRVKEGSDVVIKIDGVPYENGTFNREIALKLLSNEKFRDKIKSMAENDQEFLLFGEKSAAKNSD